MARARQTYEPLGAPEEFIRHIAAVASTRDALSSPRCDTPEKRAIAKQVLSEATGHALGSLAVEMLRPIALITMLAKCVRDLAPKEYDAWVDLQFSVGVPLGLVTAVRTLSGANRAREEMIDEHLEEGKLAAGSVTPTLNHLSNFVGILRLRLEADLGVTTVDEQLELDLALEAYMTARRIKMMAESLIAPIPVERDVMRGLKLLTQAKAFDRIYLMTIDRMRARRRRRSMTVQITAESKVNAAVIVSATEYDESKTASA